MTSSIEDRLDDALATIDVAAVTVLLAEVADIRQLRFEDFPVLSIAIVRSVSWSGSVRNASARLEIVELLLARGAEIDEPSDDDRTAFLYAVQQGDCKLAQLLAARGASVHHSSDAWGKVWYFGYNSLDLLRPSRFSLLETLLGVGAPVDDFGPTMLVAAAQKADDRHGSADDVAVCRKLLELGVSASTSHDGFSVLTLTHSAKVAELLLDHGAHIDAPRPDGATALMRAAAQADVFVGGIELLMARGARHDLVDRAGRGVLAHAQNEAIRARLKALGVQGDAPLPVKIARHVFVIQAADKTIEVSFDEEPDEWNELYGSGEAVTGREPEQFQEDDRYVGRMKTKLPLAEVIRILVDDAGLINHRTEARLRQAADLG